MYAWKTMTAAQREDALRERQLRGMPFHSPPHYGSDVPCLYHLTAACYQHQPIIGHSPARMATFEAELLRALVITSTDQLPGDEMTDKVLFWCLLPNHWHALIRTRQLPVVIKRIGRLHGRVSYAWNGEENTRGRTCWHRCTDRRMRNENHVYATVNYILNNPVHHGYTSRWQDWPYSNASAYLDAIGPDEAAKRWRAYPILEYGKGWDDAEL